MLYYLLNTTCDEYVDCRVSNLVLCYFLIRVKYFLRHLRSTRFLLTPILISYACLCLTCNLERVQIQWHSFYRKITRHSNMSPRIYIDLFIWKDLLCSSVPAFLKISFTETGIGIVSSTFDDIIRGGVWHGVLDKAPCFIIFSVHVDMFLVWWTTFK